jgi:hypothetical protein
MNGRFEPSYVLILPQIPNLQSTWHDKTNRTFSIPACLNVIEGFDLVQEERISNKDF